MQIFLRGLALASPLFIVALLVFSSPSRTGGLFPRLKTPIKSGLFYYKQTAKLYLYYIILHKSTTSSKVVVTSSSGFFVSKLTTIITITPNINAGKSS